MYRRLIGTAVAATLAVIGLGVAAPAPAQAQQALFRLVNDNSEQCMAVRAGSWTPGAAVIQYPCGIWPDHVWEVRPTGTGTFQIINNSSWQCLSLSVFAPYLVQWPCGAGADQQWQFASVGTNLYRIINVSSRNCVAVPGGTLLRDTQLIQWPCGPYLDHQWHINAA